MDQPTSCRFGIGTDSDGFEMGGKSAIEASDAQRVALTAFAGSRERAEADRARAVLLTLAGWTSPRIAEAFGVRDDTVRLWRADFGGGGVEALKASIAPGPLPVKSATALRVVTPLLEVPVADGILYRAGIGIDVIGPEFKAAWSSRLKATRFHRYVNDLPAQFAATRLGIVAETMGGGFKHQTLDYLYSRVPVAAYEGALSGIPDDIRRHFLLRPDPTSLTRAIVDIVDDIDRLNRM
jgi:hypothetical protein